MPMGTAARLTEAVQKGLGHLGVGTSKKEAAKENERADELGVQAVGFHSDDERIEHWEDRLWSDDNELVDDRSREWRQHIHYCANEQHISYHREARRWLPKRPVPWRVRSVHNIVQKAVNIRVARLTENKPTINVVAGKPDRGAIERAEYKESLFWSLWDKLAMHLKLVLCRRWASKTGSGFIEFGWDPEAGEEVPVTRKEVRYRQEPVLGPDGQPTGETEQVFDGIDEFYIGVDGQVLGPVESQEEDPNRPGRVRTVRNPVPDDCDVYCEGEVFADVRPPDSVRYDKYVDDIWESYYVQTADVLPATRILSIFQGRKYEELLREAQFARDGEKVVQWAGLGIRAEFSDLGAPTQAGAPTEDGDSSPLDKEFLVRTTWIYPKNRWIKKLWGRKGALIITVGGKLFFKGPLPEWAQRRCNFVQLVDVPEEGNHYGKSFLRDLIPLQDDINRTRSQMAERQAILSRMLLWAPQNHQTRLQLLGGLPGVLVTSRSREHKPEPLNLGGTDPAGGEFLEASLAAAQDVGNMNDASTGKNPAAGTAAKAIYALQYADERSISETSTLQDIAIKRIAEILDAITRVEYKEARKIRIVGQDRSFMVEQDIRPEDLQADVDYHIVPGSMTGRSKEAVKNEVMALLEAQLIEPWEARKALPSAVPDMFRRSADLQESAVRRQLQDILEGNVDQVAPEPWQDPNVGKSVLEEWLLSAKAKLVGETQRRAVQQLWQAFGVQAQMLAQPQQPQPQQGQGGAQPAMAGAVPQQPQPDGAAVGPAEGAQQLEQQATEAMEAGLGA